MPQGAYLCLEMVRLVGFEPTTSASAGQSNECWPVSLGAWVGRSVRVIKPVCVGVVLPDSLASLLAKSDVIEVPTQSHRVYAPYLYGLDSIVISGTDTAPE